MYLTNEAHQPDNKIFDLLKEMVREAGGTLVGVQYDLMDVCKAQLWFTNPNTKSPLNVPISADPNDIDPQIVIASIRTLLTLNDCDHNNRKVSIHAKKLREFSERLSKLSEEIAAIYEEKR